MKKIARTFAAFLTVLCVLLGQGGVLLAMEAAPFPSVCTKCPCESEKPTCCVEKSEATESTDSPALPASELRVLQPVSWEPIEVGVVDLYSPSTVYPPGHDLASVRSTNVPLFLRHRAILI